MHVVASEIRRDNIGQGITLDTMDTYSNDESVVTGLIESVERRPDRVIITVGGTEYELGLNEEIDIFRSMTLNELARQGNRTRGLTLAEAKDMLAEAVEPGSEFRVTLEEIIRETLTEVIQTELSKEQ